MLGMWYLLLVTFFFVSWKNRHKIIRLFCIPRNTLNFDLTVDSFIPSLKICSTKNENLLKYECLLGVWENKGYFFLITFREEGNCRGIFSNKGTLTFDHFLTFGEILKKFPTFFNFRPLILYLFEITPAIGHFRVTLGLCFKTTLTAKMSLICMKMNLMELFSYDGFARGLDLTQCQHS